MPKTALTTRPQFFRYLLAARWALPAPRQEPAAEAAPLISNGLLTVLIVAGVAWRLWRYLLQFPLWPDEAFVTLNLLDQTYAGLAEPLRFIQVAPYFFLCTELAAFRWLGGSELSLHLAALLAGVAGLLLFVRLARQLLDPDSAALASGILAVSYFCVQYSAEVKPYSLDLCMAVGYLLVGLAWLRAPERWRWPAMFAAFTPLALGFSYPSVFVGGGVAFTLACVWLRRPTWRGGLQLACAGAALVASFGLLYALVGVKQFQSAGAEQNPYWSEWFFPWKEPLAWPRWLWDTHAGALMAYPLGQRDGQSAFTLLLFLVGVGAMARRRRFAALALLLAPFGLTLLASALGRYPYGGNARVAQHLAPSIILLAGLGGVSLLQRLCAAAATRRRLATAACGLLLLIALGGMARDAWMPAKSANDLLARHLPLRMKEWAGPQAPLALLGQPGDLFKGLEWHLRLTGRPFIWADEIAAKLPADCDEAILVALRGQTEGAAERFAALRPGAWRIERDERFDMNLRDAKAKDAGRLRVLVVRRDKAAAADPWIPRPPAR